MTTKTIVVAAALDTKIEGARILRKLIRARGHRVLMMDVGTGGNGRIGADIPAGEVALAGGEDIQRVRRMTDTARASAVMIQGAIRRVRDLREKGELDGIISVGGATGTATGTSIMKALPFGVGKVMISSSIAVPAYTEGYFGTKDIAILHSVVDIAGTNALVVDVLQRGAGAICGMVEAGTGRGLARRRSNGRPLIALTQFKFSERCCSGVRRALEDAGCDVIPFHAQGVGDRAMEELIAERVFDGLVDVVPAGVSEELLGGNRAAGPTRLEKAGEAGIPQVITPCGFDMLSCGPAERGERGDPLWSSRDLHKRKRFSPDAFRVQARTTGAELKLVAREVARKLNAAKGPVTVLIPRKGWSSLDRPGMPLHDPRANRAFCAELKAALHPRVTLVELALHLNSPAFARAIVARFLPLVRP